MKKNKILIFYILLAFIILPLFLQAIPEPIENSPIQDFPNEKNNLINNHTITWGIISILVIILLIFVYIKRDIFKFRKASLIIFLIIILLANTPFIGTTNIFANPCTCECLFSLSETEEVCDCNNGCYHIFDARNIFWWPWRQLEWSIKILSYSKFNGEYEFIINTGSIPILNGINRLITYPNIRDIGGLILNLIYFYLLSCILLRIYQNVRDKYFKEGEK